MNRILTTVTLTIACALLLAACGQDEPETVIKEVPVEVIVEKEVVKEVPVEVVVEKEVVREVQVPSETVVRTKEVIKEVPVEVVVTQEVVKELPVLALPAAPQGPAGPQGAQSQRGPSATPAPAGLPAFLPSATTFQDYQRSRFVSAAEDSVSTFSLDTDRTSYHLALNWARSGYEVEPDSVRAEEWINAFNYRYDRPLRQDSFGITTDVFMHPLDSRKHLARIAFQAPEMQDDTPLNVTLVLDASGSMSNGDRGQHRAGGRREHQTKPGRAGPHSRGSLHHRGDRRADGRAQQPGRPRREAVHRSARAPQLHQRTGGPGPGRKARRPGRAESGPKPTTTSS